MWGSVMPNNKFQFAMTVDDVALAHWYCEKNFRNLIAFFDENGVKATFFVVPVDEESEKPFYEVFPELPEIINMADRVYVMYDGRITGCIDYENVSQEAIMQLATLETAGGAKE